MGPALAVVAGVAAVAVTALLRREHEASRRVARAVGRLEGHSPALGGSLPTHLDALEAATQSAADARQEAATASRLVRAIDAIPQGVVICDAQGTVVFQNAVGAALAGARHGDALVSAAVGELLASAVAGTAESREVELYGPPRRVVLLNAYPLALGDDGATTGGLAVIEDISERRRLELVRRDFVANISHELKTPVGALGLLAETLLDAEEATDRDRLARRMLDETARVNETIDDLLALSRIEADDGAQRVPVALGPLVREVVARAAPAAASRDVDIVANVPDDLEVVGDPRQLASALFNLVDNAVKYSDPAGTVTVTGAVADGWVRCAVADHGPGIAARDQERIFERFYRVDRGRSRETGGTGLGLAIVRHVATNHGGDVLVDSREGEGSTFTLRLPAAGHAAAPRPYVAPAPAPEVGPGGPTSTPSDAERQELLR